MRMNERNESIVTSASADPLRRTFSVPSKTGTSEAFVVLSFPDLIGESTLRQAQGDTCHGELVEPWIIRSSPRISMTDLRDRD